MEKIRRKINWENIVFWIVIAVLGFLFLYLLFTGGAFE